MSKRSIKITMSAVWVAAAALTAAAPANAMSARGPLTDVRVATHFDLSAGQMPENITLLPDGTANVTFAASRQVAQVTPRGTTRILATLPAPADGGVNTPALGFPLATGIVHTSDGTVYVLYATGTADLTGLWRLRRGQAPRRIAALPANGLPDGLALDEHSKRLYITDSVLGTVWTVPVTGGTPTAWSTAPELVEEYRSRRPGASNPELHSAIVSDALFRNGTRRMATAHAASHSARTFLYEFAWQSNALEGRLGAAHTIELPFVFDNVQLLDLHGSRALLGTATPPTDLAQRMHQTWIRFATTGNPGWAPYEPVHLHTMHIADTWKVTIPD